MAERKGFEPLWLAPNGFQDRLVMTASIPLRVTKLFYHKIEKMSTLYLKFYLFYALLDIPCIK